MEECNHIEVNLDNQPSTLDVLGMIVSRIDHLPAIRSGMDLVAGLIVRTVRLGSMADLAGVATGDIICEVDGCPVMDICELDKILVEHDPQAPVRMLFRRIGAWHYLAFSCEDSISTT
jgi:S1-C subfamily serine protease